MEHFNIESFEAGARPWAAASSLLSSNPESQTLFFDHQRASSGRGGFSILCSRPTRWLSERGGRFFEGPSGRPVADARAWMLEHQPPPIAYEGPLPFIGGLAGFLSFEFGLEGARSELKTPQLWVGVFEAAALFDHRRSTWSIVGSGEGAGHLQEVIESGGDWMASGEGEQGALCADDGGDGYAASVRDALAAIERGELSQVNYTERFRGRWRGDRRELYDRLRSRAPGDYGGFVDVDDIFLASISPEQFLAIEDRHIVVRPIKGTRPRGQTVEEDERLAQELLASPKDRAENELIVELMRRDLAQVCKPASVKVSEFCALHSFPSVHHLISTVEGELEESQSELEAFLSCFPAGSITGSPKRRSIDWIVANESTPRGPYTGSLFYLSRHGRLDSNVLIRTAVLVGDEVEYGAGGAVVAGSSPRGEYEEALWKARPFFDALRG